MKNCIAVFSVLVYCAFLGECMFLNLNSTRASLYSNNKIVLKFLVANGTPPYRYSFLGVPLEWTSVNNDLVVSNFTLNKVSVWTFDMVIGDAQNTQYFQTVKMVLNGYQIELTPVTIGVTRPGFNAIPQTSPGLFNSPQLAQNPTPSSNSIQKNNIFDITSLINSYPGYTLPTSQQSAFGIDYSANSIITPQVIRNADPNKQITEYEVKRNAVFLRQQNAVKSIANLVTVIQRLNKTIENITQIIAQNKIQLNATRNGSQQCAISLFSIENTQVKIINAVSDRQNRIDQFQTQINANIDRSDALAKDIRNLQIRKDFYSQQIQPEGNQLSNYEGLLQTCQRNTSVLLSQVDQKKDKVQKNNFQISNLQTEINEADARYRDVTGSLAVVRSKITDLKAELKKAENQQLSLASDQGYYKIIPIIGRQKINNYTLSNKQIQTQILNLTNLVSANSGTCQNFVRLVDGLKVKIASQRQIFSQLNNQTIQKQAQLGAINSVTSLLKDSMSILPLQIAALQAELSKFNARVSQQKYLCQTANEFVQKFQNTLNFNLNQLAAYSTSIKDTTANLQKARAQKLLADLAVEEIIQSSANVLPFSIVPNGGSTILGGTPLGNNPSGSALGPSFRVDADSKGVQNPYQVGNISNYLSTIYGLNIDPVNLFSRQSSNPQSTNSGGLDSFIPGTILIQTAFIATAANPTINSNSNNNTPVSAAYLSQLQTNAILYPMSQNQRSQITSLTDLASGLSSFNCVGTSTVISIQGTIQSISLGSINVRDILNQSYTVSLSVCTTISSTKNTSFFETGNKIFISGVKAYQIFGTILFNAFTVLIIPK